MNRTSSRTRWKRLAVFSVLFLLTAAGLVALLLVLAGVFQTKVGNEPASTHSTTLPASARIEEVRVVERSRSETAVGTVRPVHEAAVASRLLSRVVEMNVVAGQVVNEGDVLVRLDDDELLARREQAVSAVASAESRRQRAANDHARAVPLVENRTIARADFDQLVAELKMAEAEVRRAQQAVEEAKVTLDYATIRSPLTGVVVDKLVETGDTVTPGQVLLTLYEPSRMQLVATVRESLAQRLKVGDQIPAQLDALEHECLATVSEVVPEAESGSRSFTVKVTGPCPPGVYSGMFGRIRIPLSDEQVLVVAPEAVSRVGQLTLVDMVQGDQVQRRNVQLGRKLPEGYEVLAGLHEGEQVVLSRPDTAEEGQ